jgi:hypothetical protein
MPIGMMRPNAMSGPPTSVSLAYETASGAQNAGGAKSSQAPTIEMSHDTRPRVGLSASADMVSAQAPLRMSLQMSARLA